MTRIMLAAMSLFLFAVTANSQVLDARKINSPHVEYVAPKTLKKYPLPVLDYQHDWER